MQDILAANNYVNQSFTNVSSTGSSATGTPWCINQLPNTGVYAWMVIPNGTVTSVTAELFGSIDGANWFLMDTITQNDTPGAANSIFWTGWNSTTGEIRWVKDRPVGYLRIDPITVNGGGSVTGTFSLFEPNR